MTLEKFDLAHARTNAGLSQRQLANKVGISRESVQRLEAGIPLRPATAKKIADYFDVLVTDLMPLAEAA